MPPVVLGEKGYHNDLCRRGHRLGSRGPGPVGRVENLKGSGIRLMSNKLLGNVF